MDIGKGHVSPGQSVKNKIELLIFDSREGSKLLTSSHFSTVLSSWLVVVVGGKTHNPRQECFHFYMQGIDSPSVMGNINFGQKLLSMGNFITYISIKYIYIYAYYTISNALFASLNWYLFFYIITRIPHFYPSLAQPSTTF